MNADEQNRAFQKNRMDQKWLHSPLWRSNQLSLWTSWWAVNPDHVGEFVASSGEFVASSGEFLAHSGEFIAHSVNL